MEEWKEDRRIAERFKPFERERRCQMNVENVEKCKVMYRRRGRADLSSSNTPHFSPSL